MNLTSQQKRRYKPQIIIPEIGVKGQQKLLSSKVLIVGCGGLGSSCAYYLSAAGVGRIGLVDHDRVKLDNLQRQILHFTEDIGKPKVNSAKEKLSMFNPEIKIDVYQTKINSKNAKDIIKNYDIIVDCADNFQTKFLLNDICVKMGKPLVHASVVKFYGEVMTVIPYKGPCYRCVFPTLPRESFVDLCRKEGILGVVAGLCGIIEAAEVIKYILGIGNLLVGRLLVFNSVDMKFKEIRVKKNKTCSVCGGIKTEK